LGFFFDMDLEKEAFTAICKVKIAHNKIELGQWEAVMKYASPEMSAFDIILKNIEELVEVIKILEAELKID
jgi:hypothetical protein